MHAMIREHIELRARLNPWKSPSSCASMTPTNPWIVTSTRQRRGQADVRLVPEPTLNPFSSIIDLNAVWNHSWDNWSTLKPIHDSDISDGLSNTYGVVTWLVCVHKCV